MVLSDTRFYWRCTSVKNYYTDPASNLCSRAYFYYTPAIREKCRSFGEYCRSRRNCFWWKEERFRRTFSQNNRLCCGIIYDFDLDSGDNEPVIRDNTIKRSKVVAGEGFLPAFLITSHNREYPNRVRFYYENLRHGRDAERYICLSRKGQKRSK